MKKKIRKFLKYSVRLVLVVLLVLVGKTAYDFSNPYSAFHSIRSDANNLQILDRNGNPLTFSYQNSWNTYDNIALHEIPEALQQAFIVSEDKRFFEHGGVDWQARGSALWNRFAHGNYSRGASTITEQVVRMLHPRSRSYWSKWIEGIEAIALEMQVNKADILELYLNQVPYASNRRGVVQAARFYFNRDIATLSTKEMLALAVLVRAPSKFDLYSGKVQIDDSINRLATALVERKALDSAALENLQKYDLVLDAAKLPVQAFQFVDYVRANSENNASWNQSKIITTLDSNLQLFTQNLLESRLQELAAKNINNAAAIVINHKTNEILAWVSVGLKCKDSKGQAAGCKIDMVTVPRQPGSALKPFLYAAALEKGWTAATIIDDSPYSETVGKGIHHYHNYSNTYYGKVSLRTALGNSLNIPAVRAINYVVPDKYLKILHNLGFESLTKSADFYDDGLALGNGEVSLFELAQAYSTLANHGEFEPLRISFYRDALAEKKQIYSDEVASLVGNILSDPWARNLEFGRNSVLNLPTQTAVKTGTSTDYRDAWAVGYDSQYVVAIWMGNSDYVPTDGITGSLGPSLALRGIFNQLTQSSETAPLYLSPRLIAKDVCINTEDLERENPDCAKRTEYFLPETLVQKVKAAAEPTKIEILRPASGLEMAVDPRIPAEKQAFEMRLIGVLPTDEVEWVVDGKKLERVVGAKLMWLLVKGKHSVQAIVWRNNSKLEQTAKHVFYVK